MPDVCQRAWVSISARLYGLVPIYRIRDIVPIVRCSDILDDLNSSDDHWIGVQARSCHDDVWTSHISCVNHYYIDRNDIYDYKMQESIISWKVV